MEKTGIGIEWIECPISEEELKGNMNCQERMPPLTLSLIIRSNSAEHISGKSHATPLGSSMLLASGHDSQYIYLYSDAIVDPQNRHGLPLYQMFSIVAAHELGHILLRSSAHSSFGLMQARLKQKDFADASFGRLFFTPQQAEIIRAEVSVRRNLQALQTAQEVTPSRL
jgi:predicted Zn-dependent protease with MMP-like domain